MRYLKILILLALIVSCKHSTEPIIPIDDTPLMPLKVGNYWTYTGYNLNEDGTINSPESSPNYARCYKITDTLSINIGKSKILTYKMNRYDPQENWTSTDAKLIYNNAFSIFYAGTFDSNRITLLFNDRIFKYPGQIYESYRAHTFYYNIFGNYLSIPDSVITDYSCVSLDSLFTTPLGDFRCIVYKTRLAMFDGSFYLGDLYSFYKPGIGLIGTINVGYSYVTGKHYYFLKEVLINYKLN